MNDEVTVAEFHVVETLNGDVGEFRVDVLAEGESLEKEKEGGKGNDASVSESRETKPDETRRRSRRAQEG